MQNSLRSIDKWGQSVQKLGRNLSVAVTAPVILAGVAAKNMASDYEESVNKVDTAFKTASPAVREFAKTTLEANGIAEASALDMAANFGDMSTSMGLPVSAAAKMSTSLVALAGDLASFKNIGIDQANTALNGIFSGETESLKMLGIVLTEANLQQYAYSQGIKTKVKDLDQASKVQLRYNYILSVTKNAQGDFARTQAGAANQDRIFSESLKQIGQQIGSIILPLYTKMVTAVNGWLKSFSNLSEETKKVIVVVAGVAAAIGPLLFGIGAVASTVPLLAKGFLLFSGALVTIAPLMLAAVAYGTAMYGVYALLGGNATKAAGATAELAKVTNDLNDAVAQGNKNATEEIGKLDKLYATAINVKASTQERKAAVDELQTLYPAYFKNIDTEAFKNGTAKVSYDKLRDAIFNKARASAIDAKLQENANARVDKELKLRERLEIAEKRYQDLKAKGSKAGSVSTTGEAVDFAVVKTAKEAIDEARKFYEIRKQDLKEFYDINKKEDTFLLSAKEEYYAKTGKLQENEIAKAKAAAAEIAKANEFTSGKSTDPVKRPDVESVINLDAALGSVDEYDVRIAKMKEFAKAFNIEPEKLIKTAETTEEMAARMTAAVAASTVALNSHQKEMLANATSFNEQFSSVWQNTIGGFAENFGALIGQFASGGASLSNIGNLFLTTLADMAIQVGKIAISVGIAVLGIKKALQSLNPIVAIAAGVALIALGTIAKSSLADASGGNTQKFANGGIVGGSSYYGDKILARVNSGEMIANTDQQRKIYNSMNAAGGGIVTIIPELKIKGSDVIVVFNRAMDRKNRIG